MSEFSGRTQASADDATCSTSYAQWDWTSGYVTFGKAYFNPTHYCHAFGRWQPNLPAGSTILSALLRLRAYESASGQMATVVRLLDYKSCPAFNTFGLGVWPNYVSGLSVPWSFSTIWTQGSDYDTPELKALLQHWLDPAPGGLGGDVGDYLGLGVYNNGTAGAINRRAVAWNSNPAASPLLIVTYTPPWDTRIERAVVVASLHGPQAGLAPVGSASGEIAVHQGCGAVAQPLRPRTTLSIHRPGTSI